MRSIAIAFLIGISLSANSKAILAFKHQGLQDWYRQLQNFEAVDLDSKLLADCNEAEKQFAGLQYHWQALLRGKDPHWHFQQLKSLQESKLQKPFTENEILLNEVLCSFFMARAASLQGQSLSSLSSYLGATEALERLMEIKASHEEAQLLLVIYNFAYHDFASNPLYWTISAWLPKPKNELGLQSLISFERSSSPLIASEAQYYSYRLLKEEQATQAEESLLKLMKDYPRNWIFRLEHYKSFGLQKRNAQKQKAKLLREIEASNYLSKPEKEHFKTVLASY